MQPPDSRQNADAHFVAEAPGDRLFVVALVRVVPNLNRASFLDLLCREAG